MIYSTDIIYSIKNTTGLMSNISVKLHGALMGLIPHEYAEELHKGALQPFSLCAVSDDEHSMITARISALNDKASVICEALCNESEITVYGLPHPLKMVSYHKRGAESVETLSLALQGESYRIEFLTPAMIKKNGRPSCSLNIGKYFRSVVDKMNCFEGIQLNSDVICSGISELDVTGFSLSTSQHNVGGSIYSGMTGYADIRIRNTSVANDIRKVLAYAQYSGVGAKTALGMGGIRIIPLG